MTPNIFFDIAPLREKNVEAYMFMRRQIRLWNMFGYDYYGNRWKTDKIDVYSRRKELFDLIETRKEKLDRLFKQVDDEFEKMMEEIIIKNKIEKV